MKRQTDEELMVAYRDGKERAFAVLYERHKGGVYRFFLQQCSSASDAQELMQDVWFNLIRARKRYQVTAKFTTYLYRLAHNRLIDYYRRRSHSLPMSYAGNNQEEDPTALIADNDCVPPEVQLDTQRQITKLQNLVNELPEAQRETFLLREEGGLTLVQIAEATGVSMEAAKSRMRYAIMKLKQGLELE